MHYYNNTHPKKYRYACTTSVACVCKIKLGIVVYASENLIVEFELLKFYFKVILMGCTRHTRKMPLCRETHKGKINNL